MRVYFKKIDGPKSYLYTKLSHYYTPRAALIEYLNDDTKRHIVHWIEEGKTFQMVDIDTLISDWAKRAMSNINYRTNMFYSDFQAATLRVFRPTRKKHDFNVDYQIMTTTKEKRPFVNDLVPGPLTEWLIRFLLEQTRTDWVQWVDKEALTFKLLDIEGMARYYSQVNGLGSSTPSIIESRLSEYCSAGILIEIDENHYQFNREWYIEEIAKKPVDGAEVYGFMTGYSESLKLFPDMSLDMDELRQSYGRIVKNLKK